MADAGGPGSRLPTFRKLMSDFGVSQATIASAVRRLENDGILETRKGSGIFVTERLQVQPILVLCHTPSVIGPSPFWEMLIDAIITPYANNPSGIELEFTTARLDMSMDQPVELHLPRQTWRHIKTRQYSAVIAICVDIRMTFEIERYGIPVVALGCPSRNMLMMGSLEACQLGVSELVKLGCKKIALYNAPHLATREVFMAALSAHGVSECFVPNSITFGSKFPLLGERYRLIEHGLEEAFRAFGPGTDRSQQPDGILSVDDMFTQGYLMGLSKLGIEPGRDVQVASHVNVGSPSLAMWEDQIVCLEFDIRGIGRSMLAGALHLAKGEVPNSFGWEHSVVLHQIEGPLRTLIVRPRVRRRAK